MNKSNRVTESLSKTAHADKININELAYFNDDCLDVSTAKSTVSNGGGRD